MNEPSYVVGIFLGAIMSGLMVWVATAGYVENNMKEEAVKKGVAEFYIDEDNQKAFRYLECD